MKKMIFVSAILFLGMLSFAFGLSSPPQITICGDLPLNAVPCPQSREANRDYTLVGSQVQCGLQACQSYCPVGMHLSADRLSCVPFRCVSDLTGGPIICSGDNEQLPRDLRGVLVPSCTQNQKCEFTCPPTKVIDASGMGCTENHFDFRIECPSRVTAQVPFTCQLIGDGTLYGAVLNIGGNVSGGSNGDTFNLGPGQNLASFPELTLLPPSSVVWQGNGFRVSPNGGDYTESLLLQDQVFGTISLVAPEVKANTHITVNIVPSLSRGVSPAGLISKKASILEVIPLSGCVYNGQQLFTGRVSPDNVGLCDSNELQTAQIYTCDSNHQVLRGEGTYACGFFDGQAGNGGGWKECKRGNLNSFMLINRQVYTCLNGVDGYKFSIADGVNMLDQGDGKEAGQAQVARPVTPSIFVQCPATVVPNSNLDCEVYVRIGSWLNANQLAITYLPSPTKLINRPGVGVFTPFDPSVVRLFTQAGDTNARLSGVIHLQTVQNNPVGINTAPGLHVGTLKLVAQGAGEGRISINGEINGIALTSGSDVVTIQSAAVAPPDAPPAADVVYAEDLVKDGCVNERDVDSTLFAHGNVIKVAKHLKKLARVWHKRQNGVRC